MSTTPLMAGTVLTLAVSTFPAPATTSTTPTRALLTWPELLELLRHHERRGDKDGRGWSPATYKPGSTRANVNVVEWSCAVADLDHEAPEDYAQVKRRLEEAGLAYIIYSTYQNTPEAPRYRVVVPFATPVPAERWADIWHRVNWGLFDGHNDPNTKDASRMFYLPTCPPDALCFAEHHEGLPLDWQTLPPAPAPVGGAALHDAVSGGAVDYLGYRTLDFVANGAPVGQQRARALGATRCYLGAGYSPEATAEKVWQGLQNSPCGDPDDPWTYEHALAFANDLAGREPPPLPAASVTAPESLSPKGSRAERPELEPAVLPCPRLVLSTEIPPADDDPADGLWGPFVPDEGSVVLISGETSAGKTTFGFNLARALASGEAFLGLTPARAVRVLMLDLETPEQLRRAMLDSIGRHEQWAFYTPGSSLENPAEQQALIAVARKWGADVILADSLMDVWPVKDEDDNAEATRQMLALRAIARVTDTRIIAQHHQGQGNPKAKFRARGATARVDRADLAMNLDEVAEDVRQLTIVKSRFGTRGQGITFRFAADLGYELVDDQKDQTTPSAYAKVCSDVLTTVTTRVSRQELGQRLAHVPKRTLNEVLTRLVRAGKLRRCGTDGGSGKGSYEPPDHQGSEAEGPDIYSAPLPLPSGPCGGVDVSAASCGACGELLGADEGLWCADCRAAARNGAGVA